MSAGGSESHASRSDDCRANWRGSLGEALAIADNYGEHPRGRGDGLDNRWRNEWHGFGTWPDARAHFAGGYWTDAMRAIQADVTLRQPAPGQGISWDVAGDEVDVGRFLSGEPDSMICWHQPARPATVRCVAGLTVSYTCTPDQIRGRGAAICAAVDTLESHGVQVELVAQFAGTGHSDCGKDKHIFAEIVMKQASQPLHAARVGAVLGHESGLRTLAFRLAEMTTPKASIPFGWGVPAHFFGPGEYLLAPAIRKCLDREYLARWVSETVSQIIEGV